MITLIRNSYEVYCVWRCKRDRIDFTQYQTDVQKLGHICQLGSIALSIAYREKPVIFDVESILQYNDGVYK